MTDLQRFEIPGPDGWSVGAFSSPPARPPQPQHRWWLHIGLLVATLGTSTLVGGFFFGRTSTAAPPADLWQLLAFIVHEGIRFSIPLLTILFCHEMGHYLACRFHRLPASLPYFIPAPIGPGTLGAVIRVRAPIRRKAQLLDVGAAGPIAGFVVAVPVLLIGLMLSQVVEFPLEESTGPLFVFGDPLLFHWLQQLLHTEVPNGSILELHPAAWAGWFGLLVTALNLLPFAQLDGGHIMYSLLGRWHARLAWPLLGVLFALGFFWWGWWLWTVIALILGVRHPPVLDERVPLDRRRVLIAVMCIVVFVLSFNPAPVREITIQQAIELIG